MNRIIRNLMLCFCYFSVCLRSGCSKEAIIKDDIIENWHYTGYQLNGSGVLWTRPSNPVKGFSTTCGDGKDADFWLISMHVNLSDIFSDVIYVDVEAGEFTLCYDPSISKDVPCYSDYFQVYIYRGENQPNLEDAIKAGKQALKTFLLSHFSPVYNITNNMSSTALNRTENQTFSFLQNKSKGITFGIRSRGACGKIYRMKMYYYYCEKTCKNRVTFVKTISPVNQSKQVPGSCSNNSSPLNNETNLNGSCSSNGTWFIPDVINCSCIQGYTSGSDGCQCLPALSTTATQNPSTTPNDEGDNVTITTNGSDGTGKPEDGESDDFPLLYIIIIAVGGGLLLCVILTLLFVALRRKRKRKRKKSPTQGIVNRGVELPDVHQRTYVDPTIYDRPEDAITEFTNELDPSVLYLETMIGGGQFGDVSKGIMGKQDGRKITVAIKTLKQDASPKSEKDFLLEASVMGQFDHTHVIRLEGVVTKSKPFMIVTEFMSNGSLETFLKFNDGKFTVLQLIGMARGVAAGMKYLAEMNFVHRDLAARNILVNDTLLCKVADFGLSRGLETRDSSCGEYATTSGMIPVRWTSPEAIKRHTFSSASDVWSYGILLWEVMSFSERPYSNWDNYKVIEELDDGYRLPAPKDCPVVVHELMLKCWNTSRSERPTFAAITSVMDNWIRSPETMEDNADPSSALQEWLESIKLQTYLAAFTAAGYQYPSQLVALKDEDLQRIGITLIGHRHKVLANISLLSVNNNIGD